MREAVRNLGAFIVLIAFLAICFVNLCRRPNSLIVDATHPSVDHTIRGKVRPVGNDLTGYALPRLLLIQKEIQAHGRPSFWDPTGFGGRPLVGNPQAGLFYPWLWPCLTLGNASSLGWLTLGHLALGGLGLFALARSQAISWWGSVVGATCFMACPFMIGQVFEGHYAHVWSVCWYPWAFLFWIRMNQGDRIALMLLALVLAFSFLTGHPQEWYYLVIVLTIFTAVEGFKTVRWTTLGSGIRACGGWLFCLGLSLGLTSIEIVPDILAQRWTLRVDGADFAPNFLYNVRIENLLQWIHPFALGTPNNYFGRANYWESQVSFGLIPMFLACLGMTWNWNRPECRRWLFLVVFTLLFAAGPKLGVFEVFYHLVPGMDRFRVPGRSLFLANMAMSVLVGFGIDRLRIANGHGSFWFNLRSLLRVCLLILFGFGLLSLVVSRYFNAPLVPGQRAVGFVSLVLNAISMIGRQPSFWLILILSSVLLWRFWSKPTANGRTGLSLGLLAMFELVLLSQAVLRVSSADRFLGGDRVTSWVTEQIRLDPKSYRVAAEQSSLSDLECVVCEFEKANVNDSFQIQSSAQVYKSLYPFLEPRHPPGWGTHPMDAAVLHYQAEVAQEVLDRMSVGWTVTENPLPLPRVDTRLLGERNNETVTVAKNRSPLPRAYVVPRSLTLDERSREEASWVRHVAPREYVVLDTADPLPKGDRQAFLPATYQSLDPDHIQIDLTTQSPGFLVVTNTWDPGWRATLNDVPAEVLKGNECQQVILLRTPGSQSLRLVFEPDGLKVGLAISLVSVVLWLATSLIILIRPIRINLNLNPAMTLSEPPLDRQNRGEEE